MAADLIGLRIKVTGGKAGAGEVKLVRDETGRLRDEQGRYVKDSTRQSKEQEEQVKRQTRVTSAAFKKQAVMAQATGRAMTYGLTLPLGLIAGMAVKTAANFDKSMAQVKVATGLGGRGMKEMETLALKWGSETIFSANESAEAMLELTKSGIGPAQVKAGALGATMNLAATEGLELGRTAEIVGATMNTFGLKAKESMRISDALAGGALESSASVSGLAQSLAQGGQSAAMYGLSVEETVGSLAAFAQNGIQASDAGTSLKTFLMRLNPTTKKAKELMNELGLDFFDSKGKMLSLAETSRVLNEHLGDMNDKQRSAALGILFGSDAIRAANIVYKEGPEGIMRYVRATEKTGSAEKMAQAQMTGLAGSLENLKGSLETAAVHLGHALAPAVEFMATLIGGLADGFAALPPDVQTAIAVIGGVVALAGPLLFLAGSAAKAVIAIRELRAVEATGGGLMGRKGLMRLGVGLAGTTAAQMGGNAVGGDLGNWLNMAGTGAATGFMVGGPMGAAVGGAAGGVLAAVQKLTSGEKQLTFQQMRLAESSKSVKEWWERQRSASHGLIAANDRVHVAQRRTRQTAVAMNRAQRHVAAVISEYGQKSRPAIHAEAVLTGKMHAHIRAIHQLQNAERLRGVALSAYKTATNVTILAERHRINILTQLRDRQARLFQAAKQANPQSERTRELANKMLGTEGKLAEVTKKHGATLAEAASKGGQNYVHFLQSATQESLRAGGAMKLMTQGAKQLQRSLEGLSFPRMELPGAPPPLEPPTGNRGSGRKHNTSARGRIQPAPDTLRLRASIGDPQPSARLAALRGSDGGRTLLAPIVVKIGRKEVAEAVVEAREDAEARL